MRDFCESIPFKKEVSDTATEANHGLVEQATLIEFNAGTDNDPTSGFALFPRPSFIKNALDNLTIYFNGLINGLQTQIDTINIQIAALQLGQTNLQTQITNLSTSLTESMPLGSIIEYPVALAPNSKWLICEGQTLNTASYPDLFSLIGYTFGGAGTSFNLPNFKSKFVVGYDAGNPDYNVVGATGGQDSVILTKANLPTHKHGVNTVLTDNGQVTISTNGAHNHNINISTPNASGINLYEATTDVGDGNINTSTDGGHNHSISGDTGDGTSDGLNADPFNNRPSYITMPHFIKVLN
jgi:microcystin-dependent protein